MRDRKILRRAKRNRFSEGEDINPMNYISNLSDVMLILAVGIMLALIIHWDVNLETEDGSSERDSSMDITSSFTDDDLEDSDEQPENMERLGDVYYDAETGTYYIVKDGNETAIDTPSSTGSEE